MVNDDEILRSCSLALSEFVHADSEMRRSAEKEIGDEIEASPKNSPQN